MALHIATTAKQQTSVNNFAAESQHDSIRCFGSVFPYAENALEEMRRIKELGLYGIKLHPDYQNSSSATTRCAAHLCGGGKLGLPIAFHTGRSLFPKFGTLPPDVLAKIADLFPNLTIIAAHMGGMDMPEAAAQYLAGKSNVYFDTAFASHFLTPGQLEELIRLHGVDRVLFATDCPWHFSGRKSVAGSHRAQTCGKGTDRLSERRIPVRHFCLTFNEKLGRIKHIVTTYYEIRKSSYGKIALRSSLHHGSAVIRMQ